MANKLTQEEFIKKAKVIHGEKYNYSKVEYINSTTKVCIICFKHGEFWQVPRDHLQGKGCSICGGTKKYTQKEWIENARLAHDDKYDYSKVTYQSSATKVCIICKEHGEFYQSPILHMSGNGCPSCGGSKKLTTEQFIENARLVHGDKYDYSKVIYLNAHTKTCIICKEHGEFWQSPHSHLNYKGCPKCANKNVTTEEWIEKARLVHGDKYDYSKVNYINNSIKVCIICPIHGEFYQKPSSHLQGCGCQICNESHMEKDICKLLTDNKIEFDCQKRFEWLGKQSLDFYIPKINIGVECQGKQHFKPVITFGGDETLALTQERDIRKHQICNENGIKLLYYTNLKEYDTFLDELLIKDKEELLKVILNG